MLISIIALTYNPQLVPNIQNFLQKLVEDAKLNAGDVSRYNDYDSVVYGAWNSSIMATIGTKDFGH